MKLYLTLTALLLAALPRLSEANLLSNAGFQFGPDGTTNAHPGAWRWTTWGEASRVNWGSKDADGWLATLHGWGGTTTGGWRQAVSAVPRTKYLLSGYFCADTTYTCSGLYLKLVFADGATNVIGTVTTMVAGVGTDWTTCSVEGTTPTNAAWVTAVVMVEGQGSEGTLKFDALRLSTQAPPPPPPPPNLLSNAEFQFGPDGTTNANASAQHWTTWGQTSREFWGGDWLASIHGWGGTTTGGWRQAVSGTGGTKYLLGGYFCADASYTFSHVLLKLEFTDAANRWLGAITTVVSGVGTDWTYCEVEGSAPTNAAWVMAVVAAEGQGTGGAFKFDALHLSTQAVPVRARLEPAYGVMSGVSLAWSSETVEQFNQRSGWDHVCFMDFTDFPHPGGYDYLDEHIDQVRVAGGVYVVTLEPAAGLDTVTSTDCVALANWCADWNSQGVPVMIRFAHEMNGSWYAWKMRPTLYREKFRLLADTIHGATTNTAMLWAPNEAAGYPFNEYNGMTRTTYTNGFGSLADWYLLDSNGDGILTNDTSLKDDPYTPFYPGDTYVDWVGMTVYHWGTAYPWWYNCSPELRKFSDSITGNYSGPNGNNLWSPDFYADWAEGHSKPMIIPETAAFYRPGAPASTNQNWPPFQTNDEVAIKRPWLEQVFNIHGDNANALDVSLHFPRLRAICWFNDYKIEKEAQTNWVDWTVTSNATVTSDYLGRLRASKQNRRYFLNASDLKQVTCGWNYTLDGWTNGSAPFTIGLSTSQPYEGRACLRVDYTNNALPYGVIVAADYSALADPLTTWSNGNAIHVRVRVPPGPAWATIRFSLQSAGSSWDALPFVSCPPDGAWHNLVIPYPWSLHAASSWLNLYLQIDLPTNTPATVYFDALKVVVDSNANGLTADEEPDDDSDGLPDAWEWTWLGNTTNTAGGDFNQDTLSNLKHYQDGTDPADPDTDRDGTENVDELVAGTSPTDANSQFVVTGCNPWQGADRQVVTWTTVTGRFYDVYSTTNLLLGNAWTTVVTHIPGITGTRSITNTAGPAQQIYRIKVRK